MIKVGVVGLGAMGQHHARLYSKLDCSLVGVADTDLNRAKEIGEKYNTKYYSDYHELLSRVEAVSIAVPTIMHHSVAMNFLKAGIHCLVEKPIAFSLNEASEMVETAEKSCVHLSIGHIEQFNPAVVKLKQILDEGTLGRLLTISTRRVGPYVPRIRDVGIVVDSGTHDIGVIKYLLGKQPISVFSRVGSFKHSKEDYAIIVIDFVETTACLELNWFTPQKVRTLVATGSEGIAYLDYIEQSLIVYNSHYFESIGVKKSEPLMLEIDNFLKTVVQDAKPIVDGKEGLAILKIALAASRSDFTRLT